MSASKRPKRSNNQKESLVFCSFCHHELTVLTDGVVLRNKNNGEVYCMFCMSSGLAPDPRVDNDIEVLNIRRAAAIRQIKRKQ